MKAIFVLVALFISSISFAANEKCAITMSQEVEANSAVNSPYALAMTCDMIYSSIVNDAGDDLGAGPLSGIKIHIPYVVKHEANILAFRVQYKFQTGHGHWSSGETTVNMRPGGDHSLSDGR